MNNNSLTIFSYFWKNYI